MSEARHKHIMRATGGLGNQLYQYAFIYRVAKEKNVPFGLDVSSYKTERIKGNRVHNGFELNQIFGIADEASIYDCLRAGAARYYFNVAQGKVLKQVPEHAAPVWVERDDERLTFSERTFDNEYTYYQGFCEHYQYIEPVWHELRKKLRLPDITDDKNKRIAEAIGAGGAVALHLRRADKTKKLFGGATIEYYQRAVSYIKQHHHNVHFFVFSNDPMWCKETLQLEDATYVTHNSGVNAFRDLQLMSQCQHIIMSSSSFSAWAGYYRELNSDGSIICPAVWCNKYKKNQHPAPSKWTRL
jgi:hypothetical protein